MASFYYNLNSKEDFTSQWLSYKQQSSYVNDIVNSDNAIKNVLSDQLQGIQTVMQEASTEQATAIQESTNAVCGSLDEGFAMIDAQMGYMDLSLNDIKSELSNIASILDWNFSILITEHKISNMLMMNIAQLLRIPDSQKERQYTVEQGLKFLKNAIFDEDLFEDALVKLQKAENIEPTDYFILHHIGLIYLNSIKKLDIQKAEAYFRKAAKYAIVETMGNAAITRDILKLDTNKFFNNQISVDSIKLQAAESYMYISRCRYIQGDMIEADEKAKKAFTLVPDLLEAGYLQAKANASLGRMDEATKILNTIIDKNRFYTLKILSDKDFIGKKEIQDFLTKKRDEAMVKAKKRFDTCSSIMFPNSNAKGILSRVKELINLNNYLSAKEAIDFLG